MSNPTNPEQVSAAATDAKEADALRSEYRAFLAYVEETAPVDIYAPKGVNTYGLSF